MKLLVFSLLFLSAQAFACPDIAGSYTCKHRNRISEREITRTKTGYIINADGIEMDYVADGTVVSVPETDALKDGKYSSVCENDTFVINFTGMLMYEGSELGKQVQKTVYQMKGNELNILIKTKAKHVPLPTINFICTKNK